MIFINQASYIDIHTHKTQVAEHFRLCSFDIIKDNIINTLSCSVGIHPWYIKKDNIADSLKKLKNTAKNINIIAIGECGLDKNSNSDIELQIMIFKEQIKISEQLGKPLIIHCVKDYYTLIRIKKETKATQAWIIHAFNGNISQAKQLIAHNCYLSFGHFLYKEETKAFKTFQQIDLNYIFLETDNTKLEIGEIYEQACKNRNIEQKLLTSIIYQNLIKLFPNAISS